MWLFSVAFKDGCFCVFIFINNEHLLSFYIEDLPYLYIESLARLTKKYPYKKDPIDQGLSYREPANKDLVRLH